MRRSERGFTLIEIMLALAIMAFLTTTLWSSFSRTATIKKTTEAAQERVHAARVAMMRMTREIEMTYLSASEDISIPDKRTMFIGTSHSGADELRFSWMGHQRLRADSPEADSAVVEYFAESDPNDRSALNLMRREIRRLEARDPRSLTGESYILCPGITRLKLHYYDYKKKEWRDEWNTMGADGVPYLPTHVRITLGILDERGGELLLASAARIHLTERVDYRPNRQ